MRRKGEGIVIKVQYFMLLDQRKCHWSYRAAVLSISTMEFSGLAIACGLMF